MFFFVFFTSELNGRSKELSVQLMNGGQPPESKGALDDVFCSCNAACIVVEEGLKYGCCVCPGSLLGKVCVPFDLVTKQPKGQQTFALKTKDSVTGSLTTEVTSTTLLTLLASELILYM